jgi:hypothetical protein
MLLASLLLASTLTGQVVCSGCWDEADRAQVAYGTEDDVACAKRCAAKGKGQSLAVREPSGTFTLYALEPGKVTAKSILDAVSSTVQVDGEIRREGDKSILRVDGLRALPKAP